MHPCLCVVTLIIGIDSEAYFRNKEDRQDGGEIIDAKPNA